MLRSATAAVLAVLAFVPFAAAGDKTDKDAPKKPTGAWVRTAADCTITFTFESDHLTVELVKADGKSVAAHAAYGVTDDGTLYGVVTKVEKKGQDEGPEKGDPFSFQFKVEKDVFTLSELKTAGGDNPDARQLLQGEYKKKSK